MTAVFKQKEISTRERLNELDGLPAQVAQNTQALLPMGSYTGKNLLINGDKSVSQRGDFSTPVPAGNSVYFVDRQQASLGVSANFSHNNYKTKLEATSSAAATFGLRQRIEHEFLLKYDKPITFTYTAEVWSNIPVNLKITAGSSFYTTAPSNGSGEKETLSLTFTIQNPSTAVNFIAQVTPQQPGAVNPTINIGDYIEVGQEQLELGSEATPFEIVDPATQLARCQRYYYAMVGVGQNIRYGFGMAVSATSYVLRIPFPVTMRVAGVFVKSVGAFLVDRSGAPITNFQSAASASSFMCSITLTTTGLTTDQMYGLYSNDSVSALHFDAEIP